MARPARAFVALGSNLGDRHAHLAHALAALRASSGVGQVEASRVYETEPVGPPQGRYLNAVAGLTTTRGPRALLELLQSIERAAGRTRGVERNAPRTLDLDILFYGACVVDEAGLEIPHPRLHRRAFVLAPLAELAPELVHPRLRRSVAELLRCVADPDAVRPWREAPGSGREAAPWPS